MKALLLVAMLLTVPVSADAITFPVSVGVRVLIDGTVTLSDDREVAFAWDGFLTGTGSAFTTLPDGPFLPDQSVGFNATAPGGVSASGQTFVEDRGGFFENFADLTVSTPDWVFSFSQFGAVDFLLVDPVLRIAFFDGRLRFGGPGISTVEFIGSEGGAFFGEASFSGVATAIPEPSVMFLMLVSWLLLSTKAVFRRIE